MTNGNLVNLVPFIAEREARDNKDRHIALATFCLKDFIDFYDSALNQPNGSRVMKELEQFGFTMTQDSRYHTFPEDAVTTLVADDGLEQYVNLTDECLDRRKTFIGNYVSARINDEEATRVAVCWIAADTAASVAVSGVSLKGIKVFGDPDRAVGWFKELDLIFPNVENPGREKPSEEQSLIYKSKVLGMRIRSTFAFQFLSQFFDKYDKVSIDSRDIVEALRKHSASTKDPSFEEIAYATPFSTYDLNALRRL